MFRKFFSLKVPRRLALDHGGAEAAKIGARWAETFSLYAGLTAESAVLDVGCGPGRMALAIGQRFRFRTPRYLGFDINRRDIEWCTSAITRRHPAYRFSHVDVRNGHYNPSGRIAPENATFPAEDAAYDFAFATSVFTHMRTAEMLRYLAEARRCLRPGGKFLATYFCIGDGGNGTARFNFHARLDEHCYTATPDDPEDVIGYERKFVLDRFALAGYRDVQFHRGGWSGVPGRHSQDIIVASA